MTTLIKFYAAWNNDPRRIATVVQRQVQKDLARLPIGTVAETESPQLYCMGKWYYMFARVTVDTPDPARAEALGFWSRESSLDWVD